MNPTLALTLKIVVAFAAYFVGVAIRMVAMPSTVNSSRRAQFLVAIPTSFATVGLLGGVLTSVADPFSLFVTLAVIAEHGILANEELAQRLDKLRKPSPPGVSQ